jgi:hypothetical protein
MTNVYRAAAGLKILRTTERSQNASMILDPGESSSERPNMSPSERPGSDRARRQFGRRDFWQAYRNEKG